MTLETLSKSWLIHPASFMGYTMPRGKTSYEGIVVSGGSVDSGLLERLYEQVKCRMSIDEYKASISQW